MNSATKPVVDFDPHSDAYAQDWKGITDKLREETPVAWSEAHGGFWVVTKHADIKLIETDYETFSADNDPNNERNGGRGIRIPTNRIRFRLNESDPPEHTALRLLELPAMMPKALPKWYDEAQLLTDKHIDAFIDKGQCDLVEDLAVPVPAQVTLSMLGVPMDTWRDYLAGAQNAFLAPDDPNFPHEARMRINDMISDLMDLRKEEPLDDMISVIANAKLGDEPLPKADGLGMLQSLAYGGFDTTASTIVNSLYYLQDHPEEHERLIDDPKYLAGAVDEMLRAFPPVLGGLARTVVKDTELRGQTLRKGDRVLMLFNSGNFDAEVFEDPDRIDFTRSNARDSLAFGSGPHRCLGAMLGKREVQIVVRNVLQRMPDYRIDKSKARRFPKAGMVNGWLTAPCTFTPGGK